MALCRTGLKASYTSSLRSFYLLAKESKRGGDAVLKLKTSRFLSPPVRGICCVGSVSGSLSTARLMLIRPILGQWSNYHTYAALCNAAKKSEEKAVERTSVFDQIMKRKERPSQMSLPRKAFELGKDITFMVVVIGGLAVTVMLFFNVAREFLSHESPSFIFSQALKRVKNDPRVIEALGEPISGYGEQSGKNRRRNIAHQEYIVEGETYMRLHFHVNGSKRKGTATIDLKKNEQGKYQCRFLMVEFSGGTIIVEDNR